MTPARLRFAVVVEGFRCLVGRGGADAGASPDGRPENLQERSRCPLSYSHGVHQR